MRNRLGRMLELEIGNPAITTDRWGYLLESSRNCFNVPGFHGVTACGGPLLLPIRQLSGWPHFPFPANSFLVDVPRRKWHLRRSRVRVEEQHTARSASPIGRSRNRSGRLGV